MWYDTWYDMKWYDMIWYGMVWYDIVVWYGIVVWCGVVWCGMVLWCGVVWYGVTKPPETKTNHACAWAHVSCFTVVYFGGSLHVDFTNISQSYVTGTLFYSWKSGIILGMGSDNEKALHSNAFSHWLSPCPEWSLGNHPLFHFLTVQQMTLTQGFEYFKRLLAQGCLKPPHTFKGLHLSQQSLPRKFPFVKKTILLNIAAIHKQNGNIV